MANPIEENPELAKAVGVLAGRWGLTELAVEVVFAMLCGSANRKATILFSFFRNVGTQRDVINLMARETEEITEETRSKLKQRLKDYCDLAEDRNSIIHYPFGWDGEAKERSIYKMARERSGPILHTKKPTTPADVMIVADKVQKLHDEIFDLHLIIVEDMRTWPDRRPRPSPSRIPVLQTLFGRPAQSPNEEPQPQPPPSEASPQTGEK